MNERIKDQFAAAIAATGMQLENAAAEVAIFAAASAARVAAAAAANEPGLDQVMRDERDRVWMFAVGRAVRSADAADAQAWGLIHGLILGAAGA